MAPVVIDLRRADDQRDVVHRAAQALAEGKLVAFPTDTVYSLAASALNEAAVAKLLAAKGMSSAPTATFTLVMKHSDEILDYAPDASPMARRLARRCWPGPVTLLLPDRNEEGVLRQLPAAVREIVAPGGQMGLRVPGHPAVLSVLRYLAGPLALTPANRPGQAGAVAASEVAEIFGDDVAMILDDGPCKFGQTATVVLVEDDYFEIVQPGVVSEDALKRLSAVLVLMVCTGNTCRSPMAEALLKDRLAKRYQCAPKELEAHGVLVMSAGIAATAGDHAAQAAIGTMAQRGLDISDHESQPITDRLVRFADIILTMTRGHREALIGHWPDTANRTFLLCGDLDLADPIGGAAEVYQQCAAQIDAALDAWMPRLPLP